MASFNKIILIGNLTRSPELKYTPSGTPVMSVGLACNRKFKQGDDLKEDVLFIDVVAFGKIGETAAQYTDKGDSILVEGRLQQRRWETEAGEKRSKHEVIAERITFLKTKKNSQGSSEQPSPDDDTW